MISSWEQYEEFHEPGRPENKSWEQKFKLNHLKSLSINNTKKKKISLFDI